MRYQCYSAPCSLIPCKMEVPFIAPAMLPVGSKGTSDLRSISSTAQTCRVIRTGGSGVHWEMPGPIERPIPDWKGKWNLCLTGEPRQVLSKEEEQSQGRLRWGWPKTSKSQEALRSHSATVRISWNPPMEVLLQEVQKMLCRAWVSTAPSSHSLGGELHVRLPVTLTLLSTRYEQCQCSHTVWTGLVKDTQHRQSLREFEKITWKYPLQFTLSFCAGLCPGPMPKGMLNWFSKPWTGSASHRGCFPTAPAVCYHPYSCTGRAVVVLPLSSTSSISPTILIR